MKENKNQSTITASEILEHYSNSSVDDIIAEMPANIASELVILSSKLWSVGSNILKAEQAYNKEWLEQRPTCKTDKECDRVVKTLPEYEELQKAKYAEKSVVELIRSLKKLLQSKLTEYQNV